jgi:hypothetical protein
LGLGDVMVLMYTPGEQICVARWKDGVSLPDGKF